MTVNENSAPTPIGITAPSDPNYGPSDLTVTITGLPTNGSVFMSDGVTPVSNGEILSIMQLTGLLFQPSSGSFGQSSRFSYEVTDPTGLRAWGEATLAIAPASSLPPVTRATVLSVAENSGPAPIGIAAPTDPNYSSSQLSVIVTGLPNDGTVFLSDGTTPVHNGDTLSISQLTGLMFQPNAGTFGQSSSFTYNVMAPAGLSAAGTATVTVGPENTPPITPPVVAPGASGSSGSQPGTIWQDPASGAVAASGAVVNTPLVVQPSQTGDLVGVRLQNTGSGTEPSGYVTFGQVFLPGAVRPGDGLVARINGVNYAVQMDVKSTNADGSVRQAVLTLDAPAIPAGGSLDLMLAKGTAATPLPGAPSAAALLASGYNTAVSFTFHNADGTTTTDSASASAALQAALNAGNVKTWLSGPGVNEYDVVTTVDGGKLKVEFDIRAYANGTTTTDVIFDNSWMFSPGKTDLNYDVSISQAGQQVYSAAGVKQYLYSMWDYQVASAGSIGPNVQYDVPYLMATGAVPAFDTSNGVDPSTFQSLTAAETGPMGTGGVDTYMPGTGGRVDIGVQPNWTAQWLLSQNATAYQVMMANANASGSVPWQYTDESTGAPVNGFTYNNFGYVTVPVNGWPQVSPDGHPTADGDPWSPDPAHMPDLNYLPYLTTGSHYQLELLQAQANYAILSVDGYATSYDTSNTVPMGFTGSFINIPGAPDPTTNSPSNGNQPRAVAWELREVAEAAYLTPDSDPMKAYFVNQLDIGMKGLVQEYIVDNFNGQYGQLNGFIQGSTGPNMGEDAPWEDDYLVTSLAEVAAMNIPQASAEAVQMLQYMNNWVSGLFTNGPNGYNPLDGTPYKLNVNDPTTGAPYTTWSQLFNANITPGFQEGDGGVQANPTSLINWATQTYGGYGPIAKAALADEITFTQSPQAIQAYGFVVSQIAYAFTLAGESETQAYQQYPQFSIVPRLPDGTWLENSQMQIDTSGASTVTLTARGGDSLLAVVGNGTATLTGGNGGTDLLYGGGGRTTLVAGTGNDYLFGGSGPTTFVDNTGNNYLHGGTGANTYQFTDSHSGHDTIANFNPATDHIQVAANLNGNGIASGAQLLAGATLSNGNTVLHLSPNDDITLLGVSNPSSLLASILVS
ncbi:MAG: hypothetical protein JO249_11360 [Acidobacteria bacterium]|nr:hypothetical protein [Acidobacteriota bacterium]